MVGGEAVEGSCPEGTQWHGTTGAQGVACCVVCHVLAPRPGLLPFPFLLVSSWLPRQGWWGAWPHEWRRAMARAAAERLRRVKHQRWPRAAGPAMA